MGAKKTPLPWLKPALITGAAVPAVTLLWKGLTGRLGANPIAEALNELGLLTLIFLVAALAATPVKVLFGWTWPIRIRRELGLIAFFYALTHFLTYVVLDQQFDWEVILSDIVQRKFIFIGFFALVLLTPLAITSTDKMVRRLGYNRWKALHRLAYVATVLGGIHFFMRVKKDVTQPAIYLGIIAVLLAIRVVDALRTRAKKARVAKAKANPDSKAGIAA